MSKKPTARLDVYPSEELRLALDRWRIEQPGAPSRAEAARRILEEFLTARGTLPKRTPGKADSKTQGEQ